MRLLAFVLLLVPGLALAQQPIELDLGPTGPVRYATEQVESVRFLGDDVQGPTFDTGDRLQLITEKDGWVRVRKDDLYGWVPAEALTTEPPADITAEADDAAAETDGIEATVELSPE